MNLFRDGLKCNMEKSVRLRMFSPCYNARGIESIFQWSASATPFAASVPSNLAVRRNMTVSREDAVGLLSKWKSESIPVTGLLRVDGVGVTFGGFITDLLPQGFVVAQMLESGRMAVEVLIAWREFIP